MWFMKKKEVSTINYHKLSKKWTRAGTEKDGENILQEAT